MCVKLFHPLRSRSKWYMYMVHVIESRVCLVYNPWGLVIHHDFPGRECFQSYVSHQDPIASHSNLCHKKKTPHPSTHLSTLPSLSKHQRDGTINSKLFTQTNKLCQITSFLFHLHEGYQSEKFLIHYFLIGPGVYCDLLYIVNKWI